MLDDRYEKTLLALLFASGEGVSPAKIAEAMKIDENLALSILLKLKRELEEEDFPLRILNLEGNFQLCTDRSYTPVIKALLSSRRNSPLSPASLEVLAAVAYNEPVTRAYIEQVRGVESSKILSSLVDKELLCEAGRLDLPGKPISYKTTPNFLRTFGLESLKDLPPIDEEQKTGQMVGEDN